MRRRPQLIVAVIIALIGIVSYFGIRSENPITGETQHVGGITPQQEVALGLQAAPQMAEQFGGLDPDPSLRALVREVGDRIAQRSRRQLTLRVRFSSPRRFPDGECVRVAGRSDLHHPSVARAVGK